MSLLVSSFRRGAVTPFRGTVTRAISSANQRQASSGRYDSLPVSLFPTKEQERALRLRLDNAFSYYTRGSPAVAQRNNLPSAEDLDGLFNTHNPNGSGSPKPFKVKSINFDPSKDLVEVQVEVADGMVNNRSSGPLMPADINLGNLHSIYMDSTQRKRRKKMKKHKFKKRRRAQRAMRKKRGLN